MAFLPKLHRVGKMVGDLSTRLRMRKDAYDRVIIYFGMQVQCHHRKAFELFTGTSKYSSTKFNYLLYIRFFAVADCTIFICCTTNTYLLSPILYIT